MSSAAEKAAARRAKILARGNDRLAVVKGEASTLAEQEPVAAAEAPGSLVSAVDNDGRAAEIDLDAAFDEAYQSMDNQTSGLRRRGGGASVAANNTSSDSGGWKKGFLTEIDETKTAATVELEKTNAIPPVKVVHRGADCTPASSSKPSSTATVHADHTPSSSATSATAAGKAPTPAAPQVPREASGQTSPAAIVKPLPQPLKPTPQTHELVAAAARRVRVAGRIAACEAWSSALFPPLLAVLVAWSWYACGLVVQPTEVPFDEADIRNVAARKLLGGDAAELLVSDGVDSGLIEPPVAASSSASASSPTPLLASYICASTTIPLPLALLALIGARFAFTHISSMLTAVLIPEERKASHTPLPMPSPATPVGNPLEAIMQQMMAGQGGGAGGAAANPLAALLGGGGGSASAGGGTIGKVMEYAPKVLRVWRAVSDGTRDVSTFVVGLVLATTAIQLVSQ